MNVTPIALTLALLQRIHDRMDNPTIVARQGATEVGGLVSAIPARIASMTEDEVCARIRILCDAMGLPDAEPGHLATVWSGALRDEAPCPLEELRILARTATTTTRVSADVVDRWRGAFNARIFRLAMGWTMVDRLPHGERGPQARLEFGPLLEDWPDRILNDPVFSTVESMLRDAPLPLSEVWVDLELSQPDIMVGLPEHQKAQSYQRYAAPRESMPMPARYVLERAHNGLFSLLILGTPGSGKTTLLKWIARFAIVSEGLPFSLPLFVPLRAYALSLQDRPAGQRPSLLDFALANAGVTDPDQRGMWSYLLGNRPDHPIRRSSLVVLLLDGWDEVPSEQRVAIRAEIDSVDRRFFTILTSRLSGDPPRDGRDTYEIAELSREAIHLLVGQWLRAAGKERQTDDLLGYIHKSADLFNLARNPFLLSLLCAIHTSEHTIAMQSSKTGERTRLKRRRLPRTRSDIYAWAVQRLIRETRSQVGAGVAHISSSAITNERQRMLERFSLWLLDESEAAPQFVFSTAEYDQCAGRPSAFEEMKPFRLLSQLPLDDASYHFLHATFQEYMAAGALLDSSDSACEQLLKRRFSDPSWYYVLSFAAGRARRRRPRSKQLSVLTGFLRQWADRPDAAGAVYLLLASILSEARVKDGGQRMVGVDVRGKLFDKVLRSVHVNTFADAAVTLDPDDFHRRLTDASREPSDHADLFLRTQARLGSHADIKALRDRLFGADRTAAVLSARVLGAIANQSVLREFRGFAADAEQHPNMRARAIQVLAQARDVAATDTLEAIIRASARREVQVTAPLKRLVLEAVTALGTIRGARAVAALSRLLSEASHHGPEAGGHELQRALVDALGTTREPTARAEIVRRLAAVCSPEGDPLVMPLLEALSEMPLERNHTAVVKALLKGSKDDPFCRAAAVRALRYADDERVHDWFVRLARDDQKPVVRNAALEALQEHAKPGDEAWLPDAALAAWREESERENAAVALFELARSTRGIGQGATIRTAAELLLWKLLDHLDSYMASIAARYAHVLGPSVGHGLNDLLESEGGSSMVTFVKIEVCNSLRRLRYRPAASALKKHVEAFPDVVDDAFAPEEDESAKLAIAAAEALAHIAPEELARVKGRTAEVALLDLFLKTRRLVWSEGTDEAHPTQRALDEPAPELRLFRAEYQLQLGDKEPLTVSRGSFNILLLLVERALTKVSEDNVVTHDELYNAVHRGHSLNRASAMAPSRSNIGKLKKRLQESSGAIHGDTAVLARSIKRVPGGGGYQCAFKGPMRIEDPTPPLTPSS